MQYSDLGRTGLKVSRVCLGTMTWGEQNSEAEGHEQMDYAVDRGVNFFDTAEMYAVPPRPETQGRTEEIIGTWFQKSGKRQDIILATKVAGGMGWIRDGHMLTGDIVRQAVDTSLARLQTDYIDLYQLHWPNNRQFPHFGRNHAGNLNFTAHKTERIVENLLDIHQGINDVVKAGKVRHFGLSDDTAWGIMKYNELAGVHDFPRVESIQNEFSLLDRSDDPYLAEVCVREDVAYLPWSPLAAGLLTGKYADGNIPKGSRWDVMKKIHGQLDSFRDVEMSHKAVAGYKAVAEKHGLDLAQMCLKFVDQQNFVTSTIIGATSMEQLKTDMDAFDLTLSDDVMKDIDSVYRQFPIPY